MSLPTNILAVLMYYNGGWRLVREQIQGGVPPPDNTLRVTLSRMKKAGLVCNKSKIWSITYRGRAYFTIIQQRQKEQNLKLPAHTAKRSKQKQKTMIVIFDIPETQKRARAWLRVELSHLGFTMLQKSAWFGPAPLPKEFIESLEKMKLLQYIKSFKATDADII